jgi:hypothetical protein
MHKSPKAYPQKVTKRQNDQMQREQTWLGPKIWVLLTKEGKRHNGIMFEKQCKA